MYSVILLAAMTTNTADAPTFHKRGGGCYGGVVLHSGCYGSCMGCWGAGYGGGCWGSGGGQSAGCYGCMGCYGGWHGYGDYVAPPATTPSANPMTTPGTGTPGTGTPGTGTPGTGTPGTGTAPMGRVNSMGTPARLVIEKPADAKLFVDNIPVAAEVATKTFTTPELDPAQAYFYMVRVEMTREGKPLSETRRVIVRAGETVKEQFRDSTTFETVAAKMPLVQ